MDKNIKEELNKICLEEDYQQDIDNYYNSLFGPEDQPCILSYKEDNELEDADYFYTLDYITNWVLYMNEAEGTNYDGIIVEDILDIGPHGNIFSNTSTDIITLKNSNQIKSIRNKAPSTSVNINEYYRF